MRRTLVQLTHYPSNILELSGKLVKKNFGSTFNFNPFIQVNRDKCVKSRGVGKALLNLNNSVNYREQSFSAIGIKEKTSTPPSNITSNFVELKSYSRLVIVSKEIQ